MPPELTLEDRAVQLLEARLPLAVRPSSRTALVRKASRLLRRELKMGQTEAQAMAEIWVDKEELLIDREPYEIIQILREDVDKRKKQKRMMIGGFGAMFALMIALAIFTDFNNFGMMGSFAAIFSATAMMGGRAKLAVNHAEKLRRPEAVAPLVDAYLSADKAGRAAALPALTGALESCREAALLEAETLSAIKTLAKKASDRDLSAKAEEALRTYEQKMLEGPAESSTKH
jgi:uncharacterized protein with ATP-grasp and redox domains